MRFLLQHINVTATKRLLKIIYVSYCRGRMVAIHKYHKQIQLMLGKFPPISWGLQASRDKVEETVF
jgi:hypothetical protein